MHACLIVMLDSLENHKEKLEKILEKYSYHEPNNENAFWDWWRIGGRYAGFITHTEYSDNNGFNFDDEAEDISINTNLAKNYLQMLENKEENIIPYGFINADKELFFIDSDEQLYEQKIINSLKKIS